MCPYSAKNQPSPLNTIDDVRKQRRALAASTAADMELRKDYRAIEALYEARRTPDRIIAHYTLEKEIADGLRNSTKEQRDAGLYQKSYDRLLSELADHPRKTLHSGATAARMQAYVERQAQMLAREVGPGDVFMELGGGNCKVALLLAPHVAKSIVVDVSDALVPETIEAPNFEFVKRRHPTADRQRLVHLFQSTDGAPAS